MDCFDWHLIKSWLLITQNTIECKKNICMYIFIHTCKTYKKYLITIKYVRQVSTELWISGHLCISETFSNRLIHRIRQSREHLCFIYWLSSLCEYRWNVWWKVVQFLQQNIWIVWCVIPIRKVYCIRYNLHEAYRHNYPLSFLISDVINIIMCKCVCVHLVIGFCFTV